MERSKTQKRLFVTDHAIVRYLERVKGVDIEAIKRELLPTPRAQAAFDAMGEQAKIVKPDCTLIVKSGKIVTVTVKPGGK